MGLSRIVLSISLLGVLSFVQCIELKAYEDLADLHTQFKAWKLKHKKVYATHEIHESKFETYLENLQLISQLNREHGGRAIFEDNQFADLSPREFQATVLMRPRPAPEFERSRYLKHKVSDEPLPTSFDWRTHNVVTSVKNQGSAGTCWAFSTVANIEGQYAMAGHPLTNLSVEQVVDCDDSKDPPKMYADCGVYGGWPYLAYQYLMRAGGLMTEADYPYCAGMAMPQLCMVCPTGLWNDSLCGPPMPYCNMSQSCFAKVNPSKFTPGTALADWKKVPENETTIASVLMDTGPLSVAMNAQILQFYSKGVFNPWICNKKTLDHAVLLVGFGVSSGVFGEEPYWIVKNSWGPTWGEKGYFRIKRGTGVCGINTSVTTAFLL